MSFGLIFCYYIFKLQLTYIQFIVSSKIDCIQERIGHCTAVPNNNSVGYKIHHHFFFFLQISILWIKMFTFQMNSPVVKTAPIIFQVDLLDPQIP